MSETPVFKFCLVGDVDASFIPTKGEPNATGWDVRAAKDVIFTRQFQKVLIPLGIKCFSPSGYWLKLNPRSSTFAKKDLSCLYGVIDEDYDKQILFACQWIPPTWEYTNNEWPSLTIKKGEAIGQLIPVKRQEMAVELIDEGEFDRLCKNKGAVRNGGFGSTDAPTNSSASPHGSENPSIGAVPSLSLEGYDKAPVRFPHPKWPRY